MTNAVLPIVLDYDPPRRRYGKDDDPAPVKGDTVWAIKHKPTGLYFVWCYTNEAYAERIAGRVSPGDATDRAANWRADKRKLSVSTRTRD